MPIMSTKIIVRFKVAMLLAVFWVMLAGCTDDEFGRLGASCLTDDECGANGICLTGNDYPGGFCSYPCGHSSECPQYAACVDTRGGVCLPQCINDKECAPGYDCKTLSFRGSAGKVRVCRGD